MSVTFFDYADLPVSRWRNGGGETREIACWPVGGNDFGWRVSIATIEQNGPFSAFPGVDRSIMLLGGEGVRLYSVDRIDHYLSKLYRPFSFPGDVPLEARLLGGSSQDFNVMTRRGCWQAGVTVISTTQTLPANHAGVVYAVRGEWQIVHAETRQLLPQQGCWWMPVVKAGQLVPSTADSQLIWVDLWPER
ncbi:HutD family protein [Yersinia ruckeri]|uniref:Cold inducible protein Ves n=1 Tax=Yersinia ruckeri TaxID=29486 RepID=A0A085U898_YERRU|nr:HutD family protein [Yersinia ruckeri]AKA37034.1 HutD family protein [Yersinia ruckeri]ARZ01254.1 hypothetical protein QMA0440_01921 [Yersinia ruckeri]AUQ43312.1 HutD family protein [Yersinia ruckeri]EKN4181580.1 HutD family protein [Yersinia ruckeri]EKN4197099.1 HutD family protein [Yersinia ruckeri]